MSDTLSPKKNRAEQLELLEPDTNLSRRNKPRFSKNPFVDDNLLNQLAGKKNVYYTQNNPMAVIDLETQKVSAVKSQIIKTIRADKETYVKIFTTHLKAFFELNQTAYKILQYVLHTVQNEAISTDQVHLDLVKAKKYFDELGQNLSPASYYKGMKELIEKLFIAETTSQNIYFINPKLFFNGDRIEFITRFDVDESPTLQGYQKTMGKLSHNEEKPTE